jgi:glycosyltransferase involved in cell wall biosynthesis
VSKTAMLITIVIPLHNEEGSLPILIEELDEAVGRVDHEIEVLMVNDHSTDGTADLLRQYENRFPYLKAISLEKRGGQTGCYQAAFAQARGRYIVRMDGDLQDDPRDLAKFIPYIEADADLIMGLRQIRRHKRILRLATILYDALVVLLFDSPLHTNSSSFVAMKAKYVQGIRFKKNDHRYLPLIAMIRGAAKINEVVVVNRNRIYGQSKYRNFKKVLFGVQEVMRFFVRCKMGRYDWQEKTKSS